MSSELNDITNSSLDLRRVLQELKVLLVEQREQRSSTSDRAIGESEVYDEDSGGIEGDNPESVESHSSGRVIDIESRQPRSDSAVGKRPTAANNKGGSR